ncbi:MAG: hypothetical protein AB7P99_12975 [Vicinamibacterales bacterium]
MLLLPLVLRIELTRHFVAKPLGFCQHVIQPCQHLPQPLRGKRLAFPVLGHVLTLHVT